MEKKYIEDKIFDKADFTADAMDKADYENCKFINCNFSDADLSDIHFIECTFTGCNMSMADLRKTSFRDVEFYNSKLLGLHFFNGNNFLFSATFNNCMLDLASFFKMNLNVRLL